MEQHTDPFSHELARQQHGTTKASVDAAAADGKIPLVLTDVEGAQAARATGLDCWCIFLAPASPQVQTLPLKHSIACPGFSRFQHMVCAHWMPLLASPFARSKVNL